MAVPLVAITTVAGVVRQGLLPLTQGGMDEVDRAVAEIYRRLEENAEE